MPESIGWPQLIVLMAFGDGTEDSVRGTVRVRESWQLYDEPADADLPTAFARARTGINSSDGGLAERPGPSRWEGDDFTRLTRPIESIELLGRAAWLASQGIGELAMTAQLTLMPHVWDDESGAFHASFELNRYGSLVRRPRADGHWGELDQMNWPHHYRWADERWGWFIGCIAPLSEDQLSQLRTSLAQST